MIHLTNLTFWYKFSIRVCPLCGKEHAVKERSYTKKPKDRLSRYEYVEFYDGCQGY